jgi:two-component system, cell cycle response regulator DivK
MTPKGVVLIIEDNERNRRLARDILSHAGFETLEAGSAEAGLELAAAHCPGVVLMDVQLPGIDGVQALQRLRSDPATAGIPVIAVTAFAMKADRERFLAVGFDGYVEKPLDIREFPRQVAAALAGAPA